jgi:hypothetical protein
MSSFDALSLRQHARRARRQAAVTRVSGEAAKFLRVKIDESQVTRICSIRCPQ